MLRELVHTAPQARPLGKLILRTRQVHLLLRLKQLLLELALRRRRAEVDHAAIDPLELTLIDRAITYKGLQHITAHPRNGVVDKRNQQDHQRRVHGRGSSLAKPVNWAFSLHLGTATRSKSLSAYVRRGIFVLSSTSGSGSSCTKQGGRRCTAALVGSGSSFSCWA